MLVHLDRNLTEAERSKICFYGYDIQTTFIGYARRKLATLGLRNYATEVGELKDFSTKYLGQQQFDFISLTNTVHEINPHNLAAILYSCILLLKPQGCLFIYDMERLPSPELGAVLWRRSEILDIITVLLGSAGVPSEYKPSVGQWRHSSCDGWNVQVRRHYMNKTQEELIGSRDASIEATAAKIKKIMHAKLEETKSRLETFTEFPPETELETENRTKLLYDFWALGRALEARQ